MKLALLAAVAFTGLMEEAEAGTSSGGAAHTTVHRDEDGAATLRPLEGIEGKVLDGDPAPSLSGIDRAPNIADTSGDTSGQPAGAHLDAPAAKAPEGEVVASVEPEKTDDEYVNALAAGKPMVALVGKYSDRVPVQLKSRAHLAQLQGEHGESSVEV